MDEVLSRGIDGNISADSVLSTVETPSQRKARYTQLVCKVVFLISVFVFGLSLFFAVFVDLQLWISTVICCTALVISGGFCWWLSNTNRVTLAGRIIVLTVTLIVSVAYWLTPYFALYLIFLFLVTIVQIVWGLTEAICVGGLLLVNSLLYLTLNHNHMIAPDGQIVTVDFGTFIIWWSLIINTGWLVSFLYNTVQRDNFILNLQTTELKGSQQQLQDSRERYWALSQASFEGIVLHEQGKVLESIGTNLLGYIPAEDSIRRSRIEGKTLFEIGGMNTKPYEDLANTLLCEPELVIPTPMNDRKVFQVIGNRF